MRTGDAEEMESMKYVELEYYVGSAKHFSIGLTVSKSPPPLGSDGDMGLVFRLHVGAAEVAIWQVGLRRFLKDLGISKKDLGWK